MSESRLSQWARVVRDRVAPRVPPGGKAPQGFGLAWMDRTSQDAVFLPLGINVVAGWLRRVWTGLLVGVAPSHVDKLILATQRNAQAAGRDEAIQEIQRQVEARFGQRLKEALSAHPQPPTPAQIGEATADETELDPWTHEERVLLAAAQELAHRKGDAIYMACQDPRCAQQPIIASIPADNGVFLTCMHKRRFVPAPPKGATTHVSRRGLARLGIH